MAPEEALPLKEDSPGWAELDSGIWFSCACGRIGHISELLFVNEETTMWCPMCREDDWNWTNQRKRRNADIEQKEGRHQH